MKIKIKEIIYSKYYYIFFVCYLITTFVIIIFSANIFNIVRSFTNKYSSMNPVINTGTVIVVKKYDQYRVGDIITYYSSNKNGEEIITHRILRFGGNVYVTKGDANQVADREIVVPRLVIGKVILIIPYLGSMISFAKEPVGVWLIIIFPAILIILAEMYRIYCEEQKKLFR